MNLAEWMESYLDSLTEPEAVQYAIDCIYDDKNHKADYLTPAALERLRDAARRAKERTQIHAPTSPAHDQEFRGDDQQEV